MLAPWIGGAAGTAAAPSSGGMRSLLAFWAGGALSGAAVPEVVTNQPGTNDADYYLERHRRDLRNKRIARDDDELAQLLTIISTHL